MSRRGDRRRFRPAFGSVTAVLGIVAVAASCSSAPPDAGSAAPTTAPSGTVLWSPGPGGRQQLAGFGEVTVHVRQPDGTVRDVCLLLAADETQRERGLMFVTDPSLGGHPGMLFAFERDDQGAFWMKDTRLPLSIAYLDAGGATVSTTDMDPCPADTSRCPTYPPAGPYRYAVEVPKGRLADAGLVPGATLSVGPHDCAST